jgi:xanthine dehydrogenase accessory factor
MPKPIPLPVREVAAPRHVPQAADPGDVLAIASERLRRGIRGVLATVLARKGSAPSTPGQKLLLCADGTCVGTVGGGAVEREVLAALDDLLAQRARAREPAPAPCVKSFRLGAELGMCCGGSVDVLLEPLVARVPCLVVGAGHVATAVVPILGRLGFAVTVCDERDEYALDARFPGVEVVLGTWDEAGAEVDRRGAVLVMTHDHALDQRAIEWALKAGFAFVGGVGSKAKAARTRDRLEAKGVPVADRERVRMPIGIDIGARLPDEIAVAIAGELVAWRRAVEEAAATDATDAADDAANAPT